MCWALESGFVLARPLSESPDGVDELEPELELELELEVLLLLEPQAATAIAAPTAASGKSVRRKRRVI
jgi:hypothetical protein